MWLMHSEPTNPCTLITTDRVSTQDTLSFIHKFISTHTQLLTHFRVFVCWMTCVLLKVIFMQLQNLLWDYSILDEPNAVSFLKPSHPHFANYFSSQSLHISRTFAISGSYQMQEPHLGTCRTWDSDTDFFLSVWLSPVANIFLQPIHFMTSYVCKTSIRCPSLHYGISRSVPSLSCSGHGCQKNGCAISQGYLDLKSLR